jgi:hypothetical protein
VAASRCADSSAISSPSRSSERGSMTNPPSAGATLNLSFGAAREARHAAIAAGSTGFRDEPTDDASPGPLRTAGPVFTRCCRHAASTHAGSCQAEIAGSP